MKPRFLSCSWFLCIASICAGVPGGTPAARVLALPPKTSQSIHIPQLRRVSVADSKVAKVRAVPPSNFILTGVQLGRTTVRAWDAKGEEFIYDVTVLSPELYAQLQSNGEESVVKVSLQFLELDSALGRSAGVRWPDVLQSGAAGAVQGDASNFGVNYSFTFSSAKGFLQFLQKEGWARTIASPDLYVRLGEEATFHSGGEMPVSTSSENYGRSHRHVEWKPFGLTVRVRPQSADHLQISSSIRMEVSEVNRSLSIEGVPSLTRRIVETKMNSHDGETVILSGLVRQSAYQEKESVPLLGAIPFVGGLLFSKTDGQREQNEVLMAVTFSMRNPARDKLVRDRLTQKVTEGLE